jgi:hypothetical protein
MRGDALHTARWCVRDAVSVSVEYCCLRFSIWRRNNFRLLHFCLTLNFLPRVIAFMPLTSGNTKQQFNQGQHHGQQYQSVPCSFASTLMGMHTAVRHRTAAGSRAGQRP